MAQQPPQPGVPRAWEFEECALDELLAIDAAMASADLLRAEAAGEVARRGGGGGAACAQPAAPPPPLRQAQPQHSAAPRHSPPRPRATVSCEAVSPHQFAVRVPREAADAIASVLAAALGPAASAAALAAARAGPDGGLAVPLPLECYDRVVRALERAARLPPPRPVALSGDTGRVPRATLDALRCLARREQPGTVEHARQARGPTTLLRRFPGALPRRGRARAAHSRRCVRKPPR
jgi:hypothetical protein